MIQYVSSFCLDGVSYHSYLCPPARVSARELDVLGRFGIHLVRTARTGAGTSGTGALGGFGAEPLRIPTSFGVLGKYLLPRFPSCPLFSFSELQDESVALVLHVSTPRMSASRQPGHRPGGLSWLFHLPQRNALIGSACISVAATGAHIDTADQEMVGWSPLSFNMSP